MNKYVVRSERQANGNIHFHVVTNSFIPHQALRDTWNNIINKLGYVDDYRANMLQWHKTGFKVRTDLLNYWPVKSQIKAYKKGLANDWSSPNTSDIHSLRFIKNVSRYICKYMSKNERQNKIKIPGKNPLHTKRYYDENITVTLGAKNFIKSNIQCGRLWTCSYNLSNLSGGRDVIDSSIGAEIEKIINNKKARLYKKDYCEILFFDLDLLKELKCTVLLTLLNNFLIDRFNYNIQLNI